jgi:transcriptional regulator with XRE-family HTH domain
MARVKSQEGPHPVDVYVGRKLKSYRLMRDLSQAQLADRVGLTFQQIQKYERGTNRIAISRLFDISNALNISIMKFLEGFTTPGKLPRAAPALIPDLFQDKEAVRLMRTYSSITDPKQRRKLYDLAKALTG